MRKLLLPVAAALALFCPVADARGISIDTGKRFAFTNCESGGSSSQTLTEGEYLFRVADEPVWVCYAASCGSGGEWFPTNTVMTLAIGRGGTSISCRSASSTGDAIFTSAN